MTPNTMKKAAGASNTNGPHTDTNGANSPTDGASNQAPEGMTSNVEQAFLAAIEAAGLPPPYEIIADGQIHRFSSNGKVDDRTGWYILRGDGVAAGVFGCWREGITHHWRSKSTSVMTQTERVAYRGQVQAMKTQRDSEQAKRNADAAARAYKWFDAAPLCTSHPYLTTKGVQPYDIRQSGARLLIPLYDSTGILHSLQTITPDGDKRFLTGGRVKGCFHSITGPDGVLLICEGYATGASLHEATGHAVAVAFNAGNLETVALDLHAQYPDVKIVIAADDDDQTKGNPGMAKARAAAAAVGGYLAVPDFGANRPAKATDFNDLHQHSGLDAVKRCIDDALRSIPATAGNAMLTGQFVAPIGVPNAASLSEDMQRLRAAIAAIPASACLAKHSAEQVIGMALRHVSSGIDEALGRALCVEWDAVTGGTALAVFDTSDPAYSASKPLGLKSVFKLAQDSGWIDNLPWPELQALVEQIAPQDYPIDSLPDAVRCAVLEVAGFVKAPIPLIATSALSALSLVIQAHTGVQRAEKLAGPCSLFMLAIAESGERKLSCDGYFTKAIRDYEAQAQDAAKPLIKAYESDFEAWEAHRNGIKDEIKSLAKKGKPIATQTQQLHALDASRPTPPRVPKLIYSDATPEALCYSLAKNWPSGGVISSEAGSVFGGHGMGAESVMRNLSALNQLWDGATLPVERRSSESFTVRGARLTMALQVQEATIRAFFANTKGLARGTGFLARFLVSWPESTQGTRHFTEAPANWPALTMFNERLTEILNRPAPIDADGALTPIMLTLAPDAKAAWVVFHDAIESELATGGELCEVRDVASKTADNAARLAALFHTFTGSIGPIDIKAMESAARVTLWHLHEARRFLGEMAMPAELANAGRLEAWMLDYCKREHTDQVPTRVIQQLISPISLRVKTTFTEAISELEDLGRARLVQDGKRRMVQIRPELLEVTA